MDTFYTAYTRPVNGTNYFFVKKYSSFPELNGVPDILENFGMHADFKSACRIAGLKDPAIMQKLLKDTEIAGIVNAKIIHINSKTALTAAQ
ncbi:MAG: hypothetical protein ABI691_09270 [Ginsengibacter sp.]